VEASGPLDGYIVVDLSAGIAGAYCTKLLADGGAQVIKVEPPEGDPLRRWSASGAEVGDDGALFSFLAGAKHSVVADPETDIDLVNGLLAGADAVVWSRGRGLAEHPDFAPAEIHRRNPHLTITSITPFGLEGPWTDRPATEFTLQAWSGGIVGLGRGSADRAPVFVGGQVGDYIAGAYASAATMASRMRGAAELIDLSMLEAQILGLTYYPVSYFEMLGRPWRDARRLTVPGIARAKDGLIDIGCGTAQQWFDLCAMSGHDGWIDETQPTITEQANPHADEPYEWLSSAGHDVRELASRSASPTHRWATARTSRWTTSSSATRSDEPAGRLRAAQPSVPPQWRSLRAPTPRRVLANTPTHDAAGATPDLRRPQSGGDRLPFSGLRTRHDDVLAGRRALTCSDARKS
jgi:crotonobetainyl-CoA:carnitine CoA-transferase CaiB-like acyl-CoA transferase